MRHVLEHMHDPRRALARVNKLLRKGGIAVIEVPAYMTWESRLCNRYWTGWEPPRHLFVFSEKTLLRFLTDGGFELVKASYASPPNHFITSLKNYLNLHGYSKRLVDFCNIKNYLLLFAFMPFSLFLSKVNQSGRISVIARK